MLNFYCDTNIKYLVIAAKEQNDDNISLEIYIIILSSHKYLAQSLIYWPGDFELSILNPLFEDEKEQLQQSKNMILIYNYLNHINSSLTERPELHPCKDEKDSINYLICSDENYKKIFNKIAEKSFNRELKEFLQNIMRFYN